MPQPLKEFLQVGVETYGFEGAKQVGECILETIELTQQHVSFRHYGLPRMGFYVNDSPDMALQGAYDGSGLAISMPGRAAAEMLTKPGCLPRHIVHELAHASHWRHIPRDECASFGSMFGAVILEGVARTAEAIVLRGGVVLNYDHKTLSNIETGIIQVLYGEGVPDSESSREAYYAYLFGHDRPGMPDAYDMGAYIVGRATLDYGLTLQDLVDTPYEGYKEYVETML